MLPCYFIFLQAKQGFDNLTGVDYSASAVDLANAIATNRKISITYKVQYVVHNTFA